jgi:hypothetical protein
MNIIKLDLAQEIEETKNKAIDLIKSSDVSLAQLLFAQHFIVHDELMKMSGKK